ncbi:hypothetical protein GY45DRAFT_1382800 [Cubamyces sp. BRFM 1775]|nr:hypothetical protein GY45DRAFT_1382800 [Cubamyces sp. BRFM 1775]
MPHTTILALVRGRTLSHKIQSSRILDIVYLDVIFPPTAPLELGAKVQVCTVEKQDPTAENIRSNAPKFTAQQSDVFGTLVGIRSMEAEVTELILRNEDEWSATEYAYLAIPHVEGLTLSFPWWLRALRWLLKPLLPDTRRIPLEDLDWVGWDVE